MDRTTIAAATAVMMTISTPLAASAMQIGMSAGTTTTKVSVSPYRTVSTQNMIIGPGSITMTVQNNAGSQQAGGTTPGTSGSGNQSSDTYEQENVDIVGGSIKSTTTITGTSVQSGTTFASSVFSNL